MADEMNTAVGLLVPCYNVASYLPELFACVRAQTVPFKEVICYDDASTDKTAEVAASLGARVIRGDTNRGAAYARNRLLEATTCDWVHFHDADDLIDPSFVEIMTRDLERYKKPVLCGIRLVDRETRECTRRISYETINQTEDYVAYLLENDGLAIIGVYPVAALRHIGGFREDLRGNEDPDLHVRLAMAGYGFHGEARELVTCLERRDSFSLANLDRCLQDRLVCFKDYARVLKPDYYPIIANQVVILAWRLYSMGCKCDARNAFGLLRELGTREVKSDDRRVKYVISISRIFGFEFVFWLIAALKSAGLWFNSSR
jgi:glycosyltransferase involved in cell wall biosynthesis